MLESPILTYNRVRLSLAAGVAHQSRLCGFPLESEFEERAIVDFEQPIREADAKIRVDSDQMGIERGTVDLGQR